MIIGECPYNNCNEPLMIGVEDGAQLPAFYPHYCEGCKRKIWTKMTRIDPASWTEEDFLRDFNVNEETKNITEKP